MTKLLVISPFIIPPTYLSFQVMEVVEGIARDLGYETIRLSGPIATRIPVHFTLITTPDIDALLYSGHGARDALSGENGLMLTEADTGLMKNKIIVALPACFSALQFGPACIKAGARAYVGAVDTQYAAWSEIDRDYFRDWLDYFSMFYRALLQGRTAQEATDEFRNRAQFYLDLYKRYITVLPNADWYYSSTLHNVKNTAILGNEEAKLSKPVRVSPVGIEAIRDLAVGLGFVGLLPLLPLLGMELIRRLT